jgi:eukaryotic-like serine/threonine-protein kinase
MIQQIAHYRILELIGEGGMGQVFLAEDTRLDRRVALKVLLNQTPDPDLVARFEREAKAVASLDHPNILAIHDYGRDGNRPYVVMELLSGQSLRERLDEGPLPFRKAVTYGLDIVHGLAAAHDKGIWHRDLKPANVYLTNDGRVKIVDFGLASVRHSQGLGQPSTDATAIRDVKTDPGTRIGTIGYMSPEQVRGEQADHRSDLFSFGCLLFEMVSGQRAFQGPTAVETMHAILKDEPRWAALEHTAPPALVLIVRRCLEKRPAERFQSARDLSFALEAALSSGAAHISGGSFIRDAEAVVAASIGTHRSIAVLPFLNMSGDADTEYFSDGVTEDIINALAQLTELRVAARTSSFAFKGRQVELSEIGARLKVDSVLEGSVRRAGRRLRVTAQLVNVRDGYHLWSERYDRELDDVFAIQDDIATNIARRLRLTLTAGSDAPLVRRSTEHMDAYDRYLQGRYHVEQRGAGIARGLEFFYQALALDPKFALAHAAIAETLSLLAVYSIGSTAERMSPAYIAATRALELDPALAESHQAMALVHVLWTHDWDAAKAEFDRALEINPNFVSARYWLGLLYYMFARRQPREALAQTLHAVELDPMSTIAIYAVGLVLVCSGHYAEAVERMRAAIPRDPTSFLLQRVLGSGLAGQGKYDEAIEVLERAAPISGRLPGLLAELGAAYIGAGKLPEADRLQQELVDRSKTSYVSPLTMAVIPMAAGRVDESVAYMERGYEAKDALFMAAAVWPTLGKARDLPRVRALFQQIGLPLEG